MPISDWKAPEVYLAGCVYCEKTVSGAFTLAELAELRKSVSAQGHVIGNLESS